MRNNLPTALHDFNDIGEKFLQDDSQRVSGSLCCIVLDAVVLCGLVCNYETVRLHKTCFNEVFLLGVEPCGVVLNRTSLREELGATAV